MNRHIDLAALRERTLYLWGRIERGIATRAEREEWMIGAIQYDQWRKFA